MSLCPTQGTSLLYFKVGLFYRVLWWRGIQRRGQLASAIGVLLLRQLGKSCGQSEKSTFISRMRMQALTGFLGDGLIKTSTRHQGTRWESTPVP